MLSKISKVDLLHNERHLIHSDIGQNHLLSIEIEHPSLPMKRVLAQSTSHLSLTLDHTFLIIF